MRLSIIVVLFYLVGLFGCTDTPDQNPVLDTEAEALPSGSDHLGEVLHEPGSEPSPDGSLAIPGNAESNQLDPMLLPAVTIESNIVCTPGEERACCNWNTGCWRLGSQFCRPTHFWGPCTDACAVGRPCP
jgi:hypothetical protein